MPSPATKAPVLRVTKAGTNGRQWTYSSVQDAVDAVAALNKCYEEPIVIEIEQATYKEQVDIPKKCGPIIMRGQKGREPKIAYDAFTGKKMPANRPDCYADKDTYTTYSSASVSVCSPDFVAVNIIFENFAGPKCGGASGLNQAVAMRTSAERASFYNCTFLGWQDTLYAHKGYSYFHDCRVEGGVDFIFGGPNSRAYFYSCDLHFRDRGWLTAHQRDLRKESSDDGGFVFDSCTISAADSVKDGEAYLGRPWGPDARVVIHNSFIPKEINRAGWSAWNAETDTKRPTFIECDCRGPGAMQPTGAARCMGRKACPKEMSQYVPAKVFLKGQGSFPASAPPM